ncbi:MAG: maleylpyruvate isomerase N-terminal domain-containing protein [Thermomicrobiales bacterium]
MTQTELAEQAHALWSAIRAAAYALSDEQIDRPNTIGTWSGRDVMVHIANWEEAATQAIRDLDAGRPLDPVYADDADLDAWNEVHVAPYRQIPLAAAKRYFEQTHTTLLETIRSSPNVYPRVVLCSYLYHLDDLLNLAWR